MGSSLSTLKELVGSQIAVDIDASSEPSSSLVTTYINQSIRKIARLDKPQQLRTAAEVNYSTTGNQNYIELNKPADFYRVKINADAALTGTWTVGNAVTDGTSTATITAVGTQYVEVNSATSTSWSGTLTNSETAATATISSTRTIQPIFIPQEVYYKTNSGKYKELRTLSRKQLIQNRSSESYFDTSAAVDLNADFWASGQNKIFFNITPASSVTNGAKVMGILEPLYLDNDTDENDLSEDYDMLITYECAALFHQRNEDFQSQKNFMLLAKQERDELALSMEFNNMQIMKLDPFTFIRTGTNINNPNVLFTG